ncbi:MAG: aminotransferase class V-fold PLP-dependent enzyme [Ktedonobacterales bacterium]|nr:aminotransferase class V-fold PLP-dependent enzyme [Ktedonobacterales bacterium]
MSDGTEKALTTPVLPTWKRGAQPIAEAGRHYLVRPDTAYLNHGSYGARPRPVFAAYQHWQRELEAQPTEFLARRLPALLAEARATLAGYVGTSPDNLVFVPNATHGMNIIARSLELAPGDEVLGTDHEYGAVERTWRFVCERQGARYRTQPISLPVTSAEAIIEQLWRGVTERTRMIVVSHISSPTALVFPVAEIARRAAAQGMLTAVDGAHAPGQLDLNLEAIGTDFYVGNGHKWLSSAVGAGFLYARPDRQHLLKPLVVSWGWEPREPGLSPFQDYFGWIGTDDPAAYLSMPAAIAFQRAHEWWKVRAACHALARQAQARIESVTGLSPISPDAPEWWAQMCVAPLPVNRNFSAKELQARLWDEYQVEIPIVEWQRYRFARLSIQAYNSVADVERLLDGLKRLQSFSLT